MEVSKVKGIHLWILMLSNNATTSDFNRCLGMRRQRFYPRIDLISQSQSQIQLHSLLLQITSILETWQHAAHVLNIF